MKIKLGNIIESLDVLRKLMNSNLTIKLSYLMVKNIDEIEKEIQIYDKIKNQLIEKYGEKDSEGNIKKGEGNSVKIIDVENWNKDHGDLLENEIEINIRKIKEEELIGCDCNITPNELRMISYLFE